MFSLMYRFITNTTFLLQVSHLTIDEVRSPVLDGGHVWKGVYKMLCE